MTNTALALASLAFFVAVLIDFARGWHRARVPIAKPLAGARADRFNAWRFPTAAELAAGRDPWDLEFIGAAEHPEDAREMLPEQGGQVQQGLTGPVTNWVNEEHEIAVRQRAIAAKRAARGGDAA